MKLQDMREKTIDELQEAVVDFKKQLFDLRLKKTMNKLEDPSLIAKTRHYISQAKTVIREKEKEVENA